MHQRVHRRVELVAVVGEVEAAEHQQRDWTGYALDQLTDPTWYVLPVAATNALLVLGGLDLVNDRYELDPAMNALMHESTDSYNALRISYIQNMRARLQGGTDVGQLEDVYADY